MKLADGAVLGELASDGQVVDAAGNALGSVSEDGMALLDAQGSLLARVADSGVVAVSAVSAEAVPLAPGDRIDGDGSITRVSGSPLVAFSVDGSFRSSGEEAIAGSTTAPPSRARGLAVYLLLLVHADEAQGTASITGD